MKAFVNYSFLIGWFLFITKISSTVFRVIEKRAQRENKYDCGKAIFTDAMVQDAVKIALKTKTARTYVGPLYDEKLGYLSWPIAQGKSTLGIKNVPKSRLWSQAMYRVIFDTQGKFIDVIVKIRNYEFIKCWSVDQFGLEIQRFDMNEISGFYCGQRLITKDDLEVSLDFARKKLGKGYLYPAVYTGHFYNEKLGFRIWPIYRGQEFYRYANGQGGPYFIVIDPEGQLRDVIARTACYGEYYVKCKISRDTLPSSSTTVQNKINEETPKSGFDCDGIFFDDNDLQKARVMAENARQTKTRNTYPMIYKGSPFDTPCFLWPLQPYSKRLMPGKVQPYRLVLTLDFKIMCVAIRSGTNMKICERKTISGGSFPEDQNDYLCDNEMFTHGELALAALSACKKFGRSHIKFPQKYTGLEFDIPGPYFIYPITKRKKLQGNPGRYRVVMNYNCLVAGALTSIRGTKGLVKCIALNTE